MEAWWTLTGGTEEKLGRAQTRTSLLVAGQTKKELSLTYRHDRRKHQVGKVSPELRPRQPSIQPFH